MANSYFSSFSSDDRRNYALEAYQGDIIQANQCPVHDAPSDPSNDVNFPSKSLLGTDFDEKIFFDAKLAGDLDEKIMSIGDGACAKEVFCQLAQQKKT